MHVSNVSGVTQSQGRGLWYVRGKHKVRDVTQRGKPTFSFRSILRLTQMYIHKNRVFAILFLLRIGERSKHVYVFRSMQNTVN